ncbi:hypothetical protein QA601_14995 [Chitinispirillales bacterium ANBcel5]|uniref:homocitrate synthase/isopropylmalate synthase family protein n=1 Tax=Cellulosispirillum alkaliphilum TaxID=3039283 RepID=UPI002A533BBF|nr:hypothetical protein [Chitinispirillales bacterium ANBcel5]
MKKEDSCIIVDTTLRDGAQMPGVEVSLKDKIRILSALSNAGITDIEAGFAASSDYELNDLRTIIHEFPSLTLSVWARAKKEDIYAAHKTGASAIHISFPSSSRHSLIASLSRSQVLQSLKDLILFAKQYFSRVTVGAQDATRATKNFLVEFINCAADSGAFRIRIADTVGVSTPESTTELIEYLKKRTFGIPLEFHAHNDFGLATANALAAVNSGAEAVSVTVNGVGERAGNAALEQTVAALSLLYAKKCNVHLNTLPLLCATVANAFKLKTQPHQPLVGNHAFTHESGIHCHGMLKDPLSYQPCEAKVVGRKEQYVIGKHAGSSTVQAYFKSYGFSMPRKMAFQIVRLYKKYPRGK